MNLLLVLFNVVYAYLLRMNTYIYIFNKIGARFAKTSVSKKQSNKAFVTFDFFLLFYIVKWR